MRVLLVDDEPMILRSLAAMFRRERGRFDVTSVDGAAAALSAFAAASERGAPFDVVITDMRMPGMSGGALLKELFALGSRGKAILMTGYADPEVLDEARPYCGAVLNKPCPWSELLQAIETVSAPA